MTREIKFRAWDTRENTMDNNPESDTLVWEGDKFNEAFKTERYTLMQYTGLKDKNGKEIYEGDVVKIGEAVWQIVWDVDCYLLKGKREIGFSLSESKKCEVIGNAYETPGLIK
tara:strand:+ start:26 stop:364 length:339 start_codon:yes stop_codon:yes gene_type:complete